MTVNVEWKTAGGGHTGVIADGTFLLDAARRHGVELPTECGGRGECDTCAVVVEAGAALLSAPNEAERARLGAEKLAAGEYSLTVSKPGYLDTAYGQARPGTDTPGRRIPLRDRTVELKGLPFLQHWALPNFFFHFVTAYNLLRHNGVDIGKRDFLGS